MNRIITLILLIGLLMNTGYNMDRNTVLHNQQPNNNEQAREQGKTYYVGDSRTVGYKLVYEGQDIEFVCEAGRGLDFAKQNFTNSTDSDTVVLLMGVNDVGNSESMARANAKEYVEWYKTIPGKKYFISVFAVNDERCQSLGASCRQIAVDAFNEYMKENASYGGYTFIDLRGTCDSYYKEASDGLHIKDTESEQVLNHIMKAVDHWWMRW